MTKLTKFAIWLLSGLGFIWTGAYLYFYFGGSDNVWWQVPFELTVAALAFVYLILFVNIFKNEIASVDEYVHSGGRGSELDSVDGLR